MYCSNSIQATSERQQIKAMPTFRLYRSSPKVSECRQRVSFSIPTAVQLYSMTVRITAVLGMVRLYSTAMVITLLKHFREADYVTPCSPSHNGQWCGEAEAAP